MVGSRWNAKETSLPGGQQLRTGRVRLNIRRPAEGSPGCKVGGIAHPATFELVGAIEQAESGGHRQGALGVVPAGFVEATQTEGNVEHDPGLDGGQFIHILLDLPQPLGFREELVAETGGIPPLGADGESRFVELA